MRGIVIHMLIWRRCHCNLRSPASVWPPTKPRLDADAGVIPGHGAVSAVELLLLLPLARSLARFCRELRYTYIYIYILCRRACIRHVVAGRREEGSIRGLLNFGNTVVESPSPPFSSSPSPAHFLLPPSSASSCLSFVAHDRARWFPPLHLRVILLSRVPVSTDNRP